MAIEYKLSYAAEEVDHRLSLIDLNKNLLPYPYITDFSTALNNLVLTDIGDGSIMIEGVILANTPEKTVLLNSCLLDVGTYTASISSADSNIFLKVAVSDVEYNITENQTITITEPSLVTAHLVIKNNDSDESIVIQKVTIKPQIEKGDTVTSWKPFMSTINAYVDNRFSSTNHKFDVLDNKKVDKIEGKTLSTNDFTDEYKNTIDTLKGSVNTLIAEDLPGDIQAIEGDIKGIQETIQTTGETIQGIQEDIQEIEEDVQGINTRINTIVSTGLTRQIVDKLPAVSDAAETTIYMVGPKSDGTYDEYMYLASKSDFELIGTTSIDLSGYVPKTDTLNGEYCIEKPLLVKSTQKDSYFINTEGEASLAIIGHADENDSSKSEARLVLGNKNKANFAIRDQVLNSKDAVFNIWDYNYDTGHTLFRLEPVNVFKQRAFNEKTNHSGAYVQSAIWPTDGTVPVNYHELPLRLSKVIHEDNIKEYALTKDGGTIVKEIDWESDVPEGGKTELTGAGIIVTDDTNDYHTSIGGMGVTVSDNYSADVSIGAEGIFGFESNGTDGYYNSFYLGHQYGLDLEKDDAHIRIGNNPETSLVLSRTKISGSDELKESFQEWLEVPTDIPEDSKPIFDGSRALGSMTNKTIAQLQTALDTWLNDVGSIANASANFHAETGFIDKWNSGDTSKVINAGVRWIVSIVSSYNNGSYTQLRFSTYSDKQVYYVCKKNNVWSNIKHVAFTDDTATKAELQAVTQSLNNYIPKTNSGGMYVIDTPLNVKSNQQDNYFINTAGNASLNIRSDVPNGTASLNLGQNSKTKYGLRVRQNTDDLTEPPRFDIYDFVGNKSVAILKSVEEIKMDAFEEYQESGKKDVNSGMYIGTAVWPEGTTPTAANQLGYQLAKVIHTRNVNDYATQIKLITWGEDDSWQSI